MPRGGRADEHLAGVRASAIDVLREKRPAPAGDWRKGPPNHVIDFAVGQYGLDPDSAWRGEVLRLVDEQLNVSGLWCLKNGDEWGTGSHCSHHYGWHDPLLLLAVRYGDKEMADRAVQILAGVHTVESLCATPKGDVVITGARCWIGPQATGGGADQREIRNKRWQWIEGRLGKLPGTLETADDWLGLLALTKLAKLPQWPELRGRIREGQGLPLLHNRLRIERGKQGHLVVMETTNGAARPALWACADYRSGEETYGCDPSWERTHEAAPGDIPAPPCPGGADTTITVSGTS